jgi:hypothetical protein
VIEDPAGGLPSHAELGWSGVRSQREHRKFAMRSATVTHALELALGLPPSERASLTHDILAGLDPER